MLLCLNVSCTESDVCPHQCADANQTRLQIKGNAPHPQEAPPRCHTLGAGFCPWHSQPGEGINCTLSIPLPPADHTHYVLGPQIQTHEAETRIYPGSLSFSERDRNQLESLPRGPRHFSIEPPTPTQPTPAHSSLG